MSDTAGINLEQLNAYAIEAAQEICKLVESIEFETPCFNAEEAAAAGTNSLDDKYMESLDKGEHLEPSYIEEYYAGLESA